MEKKMKQLFNKIGLEQASEDFTILVMNKIEPGIVKVTSVKSIFKKYNFLIGYLVAFLLVVPFIIPAVVYLSGLRIRFFDINIIREWFNSFLDFISIDSFSTSIFISIACSIIIALFALGVFNELRRKSFN